MIKFNGQTITDIFLGSLRISKVYLGQTEVFSSTKTPEIYLDSTVMDEGTESETQIATISSQGFSQSVVYSFEEGQWGEDNNSFLIEGNKLLSFDIPNFEEKSSYNILIKADDGEISKVQRFVITINDVAEVPSIILSNNSINEGNTPSATIATIIPIFEDSFPPVPEYSIVAEGDYEDFGIDGDQLIATREFAFEETPLSVTVMVTVPAGTFSRTFTINILEVPEAPSITNETLSLDFMENFTGDVLTVTATDPQDQDITFSIEGGSDAAKFSIDETTGLLSFLITPRVNSPSDVGKDNTYEVAVRATNESNLYDTKTFSIHVVKFVNTVIFRIGGSDLVAGSESVISKFDYVVMNRFHYNDINGDTYSTLRALNPNIKIFLYQSGTSVSNTSDTSSIQRLNNLGRWNNSRGHSMGNLNVDNPECFLLDASGNRILYATGSAYHEMDMGNADYQAYWLEATINDIVNQVWKADGVFLDGCLCTMDVYTLTAIAALYPTSAEWTPAMNEFVTAIAQGMTAQNQKIGVNRQFTRFANGYNAWITLDSAEHLPDFALDEGAFVVGYGSGDAQFFTQTEWLRQVNALKNVNNYKVVFLSHTNLDVDERGTDNYGKAFSYWDALWYAYASFCLGKKNNSYFGFVKTDAYNSSVWHDEYHLVNLGLPVSDFTSEVVSGVTIYKREFELGYVYVNSSATDVASITLPQACRQLTHDNLLIDPEELTPVATIPLSSHRGTFLLK